MIKFHPLYLAIGDTCNLPAIESLGPALDRDTTPASIKMYKTFLSILTNSSYYIELCQLSVILNGKVSVTDINVMFS